MPVNKKFITTMDVDTAEKLKACGLQLLNSNNGEFVFINAEHFNKMNFANIDTKKIRYTNILHI